MVSDVALCGRFFVLSLALSSVRGHWARFFMTAVSVALGTAFITGTFILSDNLSDTFDRIVGSDSATDVYIQPKDQGSSFGGPATSRPSAELPLDFSDELKDIPGVKRSWPEISGFATVVSRQGTAVRNGGAPTLAFPADNNEDRLISSEGRFPTSDDEVWVLDSTLKRAGYKVGDDLDILVNGQRLTFTVSGTGASKASGGATIVGFSPERSAEFFAPTNKVTAYSVAGDGTVSQSQLKERIIQALPDGFEAITGDKKRQADTDSIRQVTGFIQIFLLIFAAIAVIVGAFIIINTFLMLLGQRTQELAMLRAMGMRQRQVIGMVLAEAAVIGVVGAVLGFAIGVGLAAGLSALLNSLWSMDLSTDLPIKARTVIAAGVTGIGVTLLAAAVPAFKAGRTPPVAAMRREATSERLSLTPRIIAGIILGVVGGAVTAVGLAKTDNVVTGIGCALIFVAFVVLSAPLVKPLMLPLAGVTKLLALPTGRVFAVDLAAQNTVRNPRRTALTGSALMVGLALVAGIGTLSASATASTRSDIAKILTTDFVVTGGWEGFSAQTAANLRDIDGVADSVILERVGFASVQADSSDNGSSFAYPATAVDPAYLGTALNLTVSKGDLDDVGGLNVAVQQSAAEDQDWTVGSQIEALVSTTTPRTFTIVAIVADTDLLANVIMSPDANDSDKPLAQRTTDLALVITKKGADNDAVATRVDAALAPLVTVVASSQQEYQDSAAGDLNTLLNIIYGLLGLSIVIAALGIANTLAMSLHERTREVGMLRAIGLKRRQLWNMVVLESLWTAVYGALLGVAMGLILGVVAQRLLRDSGLKTLEIPWLTIVIVIAVAALVGVISALAPAFRAARMNPLQAISH